MPVELIARPRKHTPKPVAHTWKRIESWLAKQAPLILASLRGPAKEEDIQALEKVLGRSLPNSFRESWMIHDGQNVHLRLNEEETVPGLFFGVDPMSISGIQRLWQSRWRRKSDFKQEQYRFEEFSSFPPNAVQNAADRRGWIPWWWGGARDTLYIDLDPAPQGVEGQVIAISHDPREVEKQVLAESWAHFLQDFADELEAGHARTDAPHDEGRWFQLKDMPGGYFWNVFPQWSRAKLPKSFQGSP